MTILQCPSCSNSSFIHKLPKVGNLDETEVQNMASECKNCKSFLTANSKYCNYCGESQYKEEVTLIINQKTSVEPKLSKNNSKMLLAITALILIGAILYIANNNKNPSFGTDSDYSSGKSDNSVGHWITNCTSVEAPNPNYGGPDPMYLGSIQYDHKTITLRQCDQEFVYD